MKPKSFNLVNGLVVVNSHRCSQNSAPYLAQTNNVNYILVEIRLWVALRCQYFFALGNVSSCSEPKLVVDFGILKQN